MSGSRGAPFGRGDFQERIFGAPGSTNQEVKTRFEEKLSLAWHVWWFPSKWSKRRFAAKHADDLGLRGDGNPGKRWFLRPNFSKTWNRVNFGLSKIGFLKRARCVGSRWSDSSTPRAKSPVRLHPKLRQNHWPHQKSILRSSLLKICKIQPNLKPTL